MQLHNYTLSSAHNKIYAALILYRALYYGYIRIYTEGLPERVHDTVITGTCVRIYTYVDALINFTLMGLTFEL